MAKKILLLFEEYNNLKEKAKESEKYLDRLARLQAEFENFRKRNEQQKIEFIRFAEAGVIAELLDILDDFERAKESAKTKEDFKLLLQGVEMIHSRLNEALKKRGVLQIEAVGKPFDPVKHEAMMQVESEQHPENHCIEELQKGYIMNDRVIRPAKVKVAKRPENKQLEKKEGKLEAGS